MSKLNLFQKFLLWSAGANPKVLGRKEWLTERYKYSAIGTTVFLTAIMEFLSGGYALLTVFGSPIVFILGGLTWAGITFNLNRYFVLSSTRKKDDSIFSFIAASFLRILIAVLLSYIVAKPLELRLFKPEIDREIAASLLQEQQDLENDFADSPIVSQIQEKQEEIELLEFETADALSDWQDANLLAIEEATGESGTGRTGRGLVFEEKQQQAERLYDRYTNIQRSNEQGISRIQNELTQLIDRQEAERTQFLEWRQEMAAGEGENISSLLSRLTALQKLKEDNPTISTISFLITLIFIVIEVSPVFVKILSSRGPYEDFLEQEEKYEMPRQYLQELESKKLETVGSSLKNSLQLIKDFEIAVEKIKGEYLKEKDRSRERLMNIGDQEIREIIEVSSGQDLSRFLELCNKDRTLYAAIASDLIQQAADLNSQEIKITNLEELSVGREREATNNRVNNGAG